MHIPIIVGQGKPLTYHWPLNMSEATPLIQIISSIEYNTHAWANNTRDVFPAHPIVHIHHNNLRVCLIMGTGLTIDHIFYVIDTDMVKQLKWPHRVANALHHCRIDVP